QAPRTSVAVHSRKKSARMFFGADEHDRLQLSFIRRFDFNRAEGTPRGDPHSLENIPEVDGTLSGNRYFLLRAQCASLRITNRNLKRARNCRGIHDNEAGGVALADN